MDCGVCDDYLTGWAGLGVVARLARFLGLPESLAEAVRLKQRQRGCSAAQRLLALLYAACTGGGCLRAVDALGADHVVRRAVREGPQECARLVSRRLTPLGARDCAQRWGSGPVCVDGPAIEVEGRLFEHAERGDHGEKQSWLHSVFVGPAGGSARLNAGGPDGQGDGREPLDRAAAPLLAAQQRVGLRAASASYGEALGSSCRQRGWDDSVSVTDPRKKAPLLRQVAAMELREAEGEPLPPESRERATTVAYQPARGPEGQFPCWLSSPEAGLGVRAGGTGALASSSDALREGPARSPGDPAGAGRRPGRRASASRPPRPPGRTGRAPAGAGRRPAGAGGRGRRRGRPWTGPGGGGEGRGEAGLEPLEVPVENPQHSPQLAAAGLQGPPRGAGRPPRAPSSAAA